MSDLKKGVSFSFTMQLDEYEPVKIAVWQERTILPDETPEDMIISLTKAAVMDMRTIASEVTEQIREVKKQIWEDLNNE